MKSFKEYLQVIQEMEGNDSDLGNILTNILTENKNKIFEIFANLNISGASGIEENLKKIWNRLYHNIDGIKEKFGESAEAGYNKMEKMNLIGVFKNKILMIFNAPNKSK
jgi:hypothetical protein